MKYYFIRFLFVYFLGAICFSSCAVNASHLVTTIEAFKKENTTYVIKRKIDLEGTSLTIPAGCTLKFKGGRFSNGTVKGNNTKIIYKNDVIFDRVTIEGSWNVPVIKTSMFSESQNDILFNLCQLQDENVDNKIYIEKGDYYVNTNKRRFAFQVKSNAIVQIEGNIKLEPQTNATYYNGYYIIYVAGASNVKLCGGGMLVGDKDRSKIKSEYGHAICLMGCDNIVITGLHLLHQNGDGIAVSLGCKNITVDDMYIEDYNRNGISVVDCEFFKWTNSIVKDGGGTPPNAAIDIEPNEGFVVKTAYVDNIKIEGCGVGLSGYVNKNFDNTKVENVTFSNITIQDSKIEPVAIIGFENLRMKGLTIINTSRNAKYLMKILDCDDVELCEVVVDNIIEYDNYPLYLNNKQLTLSDCIFKSPKLFSFHLSNARITKSKFTYESFLHTSRDIPTKNVVFDKCTFDGPFLMYPDDVSIINCKFIKPKYGSNDVIRFEKSYSKIPGLSELHFEGNIIENDKGETRLKINPQIKALSANNVVRKVSHR